MKERIQFGVLLNNYRLKGGTGNLALDRLVPMPGFNYNEYPYVLVNRHDIIDLSTGDIVFKLGGLNSHDPFGAIENTDFLLTYKNDVLHIQKVVK